MVAEASLLAITAGLKQASVPACSYSAQEPLSTLVSSAFATVISELRHLFHENNATGRLLGCLEGALDKHVGGDLPPFLPILLPLLVRGAIDGKPGEAVSVSLASALLFLSFDLLDDLQDGDERGWWQPLSRAELLLAAATFPATLPHKFLVSPEKNLARALDMSRALASGMEEIATGQAADLAAFDQPEVDLTAVEHSVAGKSGAQMGLYARLAALHAGKDVTEADLWAAWAHGLGSGGQLSSDLQDVLDPVWSRDMAAGARTLPIAFALQQLEPNSRSGFLGLLHAAKTNQAAQSRAREWLRGGGALFYTAFRAQVHFTRAEAALSRLDPPAPWRSLLEQLSVRQNVRIME